MGSFEVHVPAAHGAFATVAFARPEIVNGVDGRLEQLSAVKVTDLSATAKAVAAENVQPEPLKMEKKGFRSGSLRRKPPSLLRLWRRQIRPLPLRKGRPKVLW